MAWYVDILLFILSTISIVLYINFTSFHQQLSFYLYWILICIYLINKTRKSIIRRERIRRNINDSKIRGSLNV